MVDYVRCNLTDKKDQLRKLEFSLKQLMFRTIIESCVHVHMNKNHICIHSDL